MSSKEPQQGCDSEEGESVPGTGTRSGTITAVQADSKELHHDY